MAALQSDIGNSHARSDRTTSIETLIDWVQDAQSKLFHLVADLDDDQLLGTPLPNLNPLLWEMGHTAWFLEKWVLRHTAGRSALLPDSDGWFDSAAIEHDIRWDLPLPSRDAMLRYMHQVTEEVVHLLGQGNVTDEMIYFVKLSVFHSDMHAESFTYTRQSHAYSAPRLELENRPQPTGVAEADVISGDVVYPAGKFLLGAVSHHDFVFDNEKWAYAVNVAPFCMSRTAVSQQQFLEFVEAGGYDREEFWCPQGLRWRTRTDARHPLYWKQMGTPWFQRRFDLWIPLDPNAAMMHVNWYEANAYCRWAGRRLPSEAEWELAAAGHQPNNKRHYPWGETPPEPEQVNMDWCLLASTDIDALAAGDTPEGCRQLLGNVWEWTASTFEPFPAFVTDPYEAYSRPFFGTHKVLRGGCWATPSRMIRNTWRNYYAPDRRDVFAGFRTCALPRPE